jgi:hypothetical protein
MAEYKTRLGGFFVVNRMNTNCMVLVIFVKN